MEPLPLRVEKAAEKTEGEGEKKEGPRPCEGDDAHYRPRGWYVRDGGSARRGRGGHNSSSTKVTMARLGHRRRLLARHCCGVLRDEAAAETPGSRAKAHE